MWINRSRKTFFLLVKIQWRRPNGTLSRRLIVPIPIFVAEDLLESVYDLMNAVERIAWRREFKWRGAAISPFIRLTGQFLADLRRQGRQSLVDVDAGGAKVKVELY